MTAQSTAVRPGAGPQSAGRGTAPGELAVVQAFVNTVDLGAGVDALDSAEVLGWWLQDRGLLEVDEHLREPLDLARGRAVRESLRETLRKDPREQDDAAARLGGRAGLGDGPALTRRPRHRSADGGVSLAAQKVLEALATRSRLTLSVGSAGALVLTPRVGGLDGALGRLLAIVVRAQVDGTWPRLKVCADDRCQRAFWDSSRNRSGRWCPMSVCGDRTSAAAASTSSGGVGRSGDPELPLWS